MSEAPKITFLHNPHSPDIFADGASGFFFLGGNVRISLESVRCDHSTSPGPLARTVIGRVVMPLAAAEIMAKGLLEFIEKQRKQPQEIAQGAPTLQ